MKSKNVYVLAGPNGSGKTTFAKEFLPHYSDCMHFVNADLIAQGLSPFLPQQAAMKAGRLVIEQIRELAAKNQDFAFETTLSGRTHLSLLNSLKRMGYEIHLFFLWLPSVDLALNRIKDRVANGGHDVPAQDVRRRFSRGMSNFFRFYKPLADSWMIFDNSVVEHRLIAEGKSDKTRVHDEEIFRRISRQVG